MHREFTNSLDVIMDLGIHVNESCIEYLYRRVMMFQIDRENPEFPLWLLLRELGRVKKDHEKNVEERLSNHVGTVVLEQYFSNYENGLSHIILELCRISGGNVDLKVIRETTYGDDGDDVTINYQANGKEYTSTHVDEYEDGSLMYSFVKTEFIPNLKNCVKTGELIYWGDEYFTFLYLADGSKTQLLKPWMNFDVI